MNLFILDHNFWTRNARKSIKGSKDSNSSLVSNENFSKTLWPSSWALGQATWAKMTLKLLHLWRQSQKIRTPQPKNFFHVQSTRLAGRSVWALEQLSSAIDGGARALVRQPKTAVLGWNQSTNISYPGSQSVKFIQRPFLRKVCFCNVCWVCLQIPLFYILTHLKDS